MARIESELQHFMATQDLSSEHWAWTEEERKHIDEVNIKEIGRSIMKRFYVRDNASVEAMYIILHDKDEREVWNIDRETYTTELKPRHVHVVARFAKGKKKKLEDIAQIVGLEKQYIERPKRGRYSYENMLSYLIHAKENSKYNYAPEEVFTIFGKDFLEIYAENKQSWESGRAKKKTQEAKLKIDELEDMVLEGKVTKKQIYLTDDLYNVYSRNAIRLDKAFQVYSERKIYRTIDAMERGDFKLTVIFVTGASRSGKSYFTTELVDEILKNNKGWTKMYTAATNPFDEYMGEEVVVMDDLRGVSLIASDWLKLMDPDRVGIGSARYKNKQVAARVLIINSEKKPLEFFSQMKNDITGTSEAMDQFFARVLKLVTVYKADELGRLLQISTTKRVPNYETDELGYPIWLNYNFIQDYGTHTYLTPSVAKNCLLRDIALRNDLNEPKELELSDKCYFKEASISIRDIDDARRFPHRYKFGLMYSDEDKKKFEIDMPNNLTLLESKTETEENYEDVDLPF